MKAIIFYIVSGLITALSIQAQSQYDSGMNQAFEHSKNEKSLDAFLNEQSRK